MKKEKQESGFGKFLIAFVLAMFVFIILLVIQSNVMNKTKTVSVLVAKSEVPAKTDISKDNYKNYFEVAERIEVQLPEGTILESDVKKIDGVTITDDLVQGEILNNNDFVNTEDFISYLGEDKVKVGFGLSDLPNLLCGTLRRGDVIDITVIYYQDNDQMSKPKAITLSDIVVEKAYDSAGVEIQDDVTTASMFTFILTPEQNKTLNSMMMKSSAMTRISKTTDITYGIQDLKPTITEEDLSDQEVEELNTNIETSETDDNTENVDNTETVDNTANSEQTLINETK